MARPNTQRVSVCATLAAILGLCGCYTGAEATAGTNGEDEGEGGSSSDPDDPDADIPEVGCGGLRPGRAPLRRMSDVQYRNTIDDLFDGRVLPSDDFPTSTAAFGFSSNPEPNAVTDLAAEQLLIAAEDVGDQLITVVDEVAPCPSGDPLSCAEVFIDDFGPKVFRRPLDPEQRQILLEVFEAAEADDGYADGIGRMVTVALQMPEFLYFVEEGVMSDDVTLRLSDHEIASRLSYLFWDTMPDEELRAVADAGELRSADQIEEQAQRLLADPRSAPALTRFYREWLEIRQLRPADKDAERFESFGPEMIASMDAQLERFVTSTLNSDDPTLTRLLTSNEVEVDAWLAPLYGLEGIDDWTSIEADPARRAGLLTMPGYLAAHSYTEETNAIERGLLIRERVLCQSIPAPPADAMDMGSPLPENPTEADRTRALLENPACGTCHILMNPLGMSFENYDAVGAWRDAYDDGEVIETNWDLVAPPEGLDEQPFDGAVELSQTLAATDPIGSCFVENWLHHSYGTEPGSTEVEQCELDELTASFNGSQQDIPALMIAVTRSDAFRYRDVSELEE